MFQFLPAMGVVGGSFCVLSIGSATINCISKSIPDHECYSLSCGAIEHIQEKIMNIPDSLPSDRVVLWLQCNDCNLFLPVAAIMCIATVNKGNHAETHIHPI